MVFRTDLTQIRVTKDEKFDYLIKLISLVALKYEEQSKVGKKNQEESRRLYRELQILDSILDDHKLLYMRGYVDFLK